MSDPDGGSTDEEPGAAADDATGASTNDGTGTSTNGRTGPTTDGESSVGQGRLARPAEERPAYVESTIIMTTVRVIAPFVLTLGAFVMFHGSSSAGGGFQGGVIAATTVVMLGFAFGIEPIAAYLRNEHLSLLVLGGLAAFLLVGFGGYLVGGQFLAIPAYEGVVHHGSKYSVELVELGIGVVVAGVITGLFFLLGTEADGAVVTTEEGGED